MPGDNIRHLKIVRAADVKAEIREDTIAVLKEALRDAKKGEALEAIVILKTPDGWRELASSTADFMDWIGRLEVFKTEWINLYLATTKSHDTPIPPAGPDEE